MRGIEVGMIRMPANSLQLLSLPQGFGGDMDEELANDLLDDTDFDRYGKV